jgi:maltooligosyltrehalose trehalohydrolase
MLFQGQEFASSSPFLFFADHNSDLAPLVAKGRREFLGQFPSLALSESQSMLRDPSDASTFEICRLNFAERQKNREIYQLYKDLLSLRRTDPAFAAQKPRGLDGAVLNSTAFVLRYFLEDQADRLVLINLGRDLNLDPAPEPLLAPPAGMEWSIRWSSESLVYGGWGAPPLETEQNWQIPGESATVLIPVKSNRL